MISEMIKKVIDGNNLTLEEAHRSMNEIMTGQASPVQIAAFLIALKLKGEVDTEVAGFVRCMREQSVKINSRWSDAVDGCGTGGDGSHTFNISTAAAIVAAAAGIPIAKHGNRSVSSKCGSADILEACGGNIDPGVDTVEKNLNEIGFCFMFAPRFHPAMKYAGPVRKELGVRTVFNILGPITNPASVKRQVIGVYDKKLMSLIADVLKILQVEHVIVLHSQDGLDEFSVSAPTDYIELKKLQCASKTITPSEAGLGTYSILELVGGEAETNRRIFGRILSGEKSAYRDAVLFNAGALIYIGGKADSIPDGVKIAVEAIDSGKAKDMLDRWVKESNIS